MYDARNPEEEAATKRYLDKWRAALRDPTWEPEPHVRRAAERFSNMSLSDDPRWRRFIFSLLYKLDAEPRSPVLERFLGEKWLKNKSPIKKFLIRVLRYLYR